LEAGQFQSPLEHAEPLTKPDIPESPPEREQSLQNDFHFY